MAPEKRPQKVVGKAKSPAAAATWPPEPARVSAILRGLDQLYPNADCELDYKNPFQLLCATILSAQCTDKRVNEVTPHLFKLFPTPQAMADAEPAVLESTIRSTGFYSQKAKSLRGAARIIVDKHGGHLPKTMDEFCHLPGVGRKTANVVLGTAMGIVEGIVVDTHVKRVSARLALTRASEPEKIEQDLMPIIPRPHWVKFGHQVIWHGRRLCFARKPDCEHCPLVPHCPAAFKE